MFIGSKIVIPHSKVAFSNIAIVVEIDLTKDRIVKPINVEVVLTMISLVNTMLLLTNTDVRAGFDNFLVICFTLSTRWKFHLTYLCLKGLYQQMCKNP